MAEDAAAQAIVDSFQKLTDILKEIARQMKVERQMVELLVAISHTHHPETETLLAGARQMLDTLGQDATGTTRKDVDAYLKRMDELLSIKKTGFKPTVH